MRRLVALFLTLILVQNPGVAAVARPAMLSDPHAIADRLGDGVQIDRRSGEVRLSGKSHKGYVRAYACPSFAAARAVVKHIPAANDRAGTVDRQVTAMRAALRRQGCTAARGRFRITATGDDVWINHGYEAEENWVAAAARNIHGRSLGLVIDASPFGPVQ